MTDRLKVKFRVQRDTARLVRVSAGDDGVMAEVAGVNDQFLQPQRADAAPVMLVIDSDRVLSVFFVVESMFIGEGRCRINAFNWWIQWLVA